MSTEVFALKLMPKYAMQEGGSKLSYIYNWSNPQRTFDLPLEKLNFDYEVVQRSGILILATQKPTQKPTNASAMAVKNLRKELPKLLEHYDEGTIVAYWKMMEDESERNQVLAKLTTAPIFNDDIL